ncbi:gametocyte-specific factor 1 homolog [Drosophila grimshawi]|uniref:GH14602 n=1 Tax=Drosophila grimshawi TaxID=7222 RepID=B4IYD6_DROGR|nr:gametocyte-specific factor 1 homolog [Drosophila grimshawi]EDV97609.1 GH14602 [Drosophila grimshawi]
MASSDSFNDFVTCPYNKAHKLIRGRLTKHLERCSRISGNSKQFLVCPYNENHRYKAEELSLHMKECPERIRWHSELQKEDPRQQATETTWSISAECEEDWDKEPDVPTYNPIKYCEDNFVARTTAINGKSKAARRDFRANERRRLAGKQ